MKLHKTFVISLRYCIRTIILIVVGIAISELVLYLIYSTKFQNNKHYINDKKVILCIGDSYTFGGEVKPEDSYPAKLQKLIGDDKEVINAGQCEADTSQINEKLNKIVKSIKPEKIILLSGTANFFSYKKINNKFINNIRVFKLINIFIINLKQNFYIYKINKEDYNNFVPLPYNKNDVFGSEDFFTSKIIEALYEKRDFDMALQQSIKGLKIYPKSPNLNYLMSNIMFKYNKYNESIRYFNISKRYIEDIADKNPYKKKALNRITNDEIQIYMLNHKFNKAFEKFLESLKYADEISNYDVYYIKQAYLLSSAVHNPDNIIKLIEKNIRKNDSIKNDKNLKNIIDFIEKRETYENEIQKWIIKDIGNIKETADDLNAELILLTYPYPYKKVNDIIKKCGQLYNIKVIDMEKYFDGKKIYFMDLDHLSPQGNDYFAGIVAKSIKL